MPSEPKSLIDIFRDTGQNCYRVRNVSTLNDLLVTSIENSEWVTAVNLDTGVCNMVNAVQPRYVLLSDVNELAFLTKSGKDKVLQLLLAIYQSLDKGG